MLCGKQEPYVLKLIKTTLRRYLRPPSWSHFEDQGRIEVRSLGLQKQSLSSSPLFFISLNWDLQVGSFYDDGSKSPQEVYYLILCIYLSIYNKQMGTQIWCVIQKRFTQPLHIFCFTPPPNPHSFIFKAYKTFLEKGSRDWMTPLWATF